MNNIASKKLRGSQKGHFTSYGKLKRPRTEEVARLEAREMQIREGRTCQAYRCNYCPAWHVGTVGKPVKRRRKFTEIEIIELGERAIWWLKYE